MFRNQTNACAYRLTNKTVVVKRIKTRKLNSPWKFTTCDVTKYIDVRKAFQKNTYKKSLLPKNKTYPKTHHVHRKVQKLVDKT